MKKLLALTISIFVFNFVVNAQLLYQWAFTNQSDTATSSVPTYAITSGTGKLGFYNVDGNAPAAGLIYFTNVNAGPPGGPGGALFINGQTYGVSTASGGNDAIATNSSLNLGTLYQFTVTFWFQAGVGAQAPNGNGFPRFVQFGASVNYDEGGKGGGNVNGVGASVNGVNAPAGGWGQFQNGIASSSGANAQITMTGDPNFVNGIQADGQTWYFEAMTYNGLLTSTNFVIWLASTNAVSLTGTPGIDPFIQSQGLGGIPLTTNASVLLNGCTGASRTLTIGQISDVRIYNGVLTSNQLMTVRNFGYPVIANPPSAATIVQQPNSGSTFAGDNRAFTVAASGNPAVFTYQWRSNNIAIIGATNAAYTLTNATLSANGASFVCSVTNAIGGTNSSAGIITVISVTPGSYAQVALTNRPYALWRLNEPTNTGTIVLSDYANGNDGQAVNPAGLFFSPGISPPFYLGFPANNTSLETRPGQNGHLNLPALPVYTNTGMTICGWIYTPTSGTSGDGIIYSLPSDTANGFGLIFGGGNELDYQWGSTVSTGSGLIIPSAEWTFVSLVVSTNLTQTDIANSTIADTNATLYVGSISHGGLNNFTFSTALNGNLIVNGSSPATLALGRTTQSASENGGNYLTSDVRFNGVVVYYQALSGQTITNLFTAGAGLIGSLPISIMPDSTTPGNVVVTWLLGTLQEATSVLGPYTDVGASSPYSVPATDAQHYYRLRN